MSEKEFVLVSQGIEIYRTKSQENAINMVKKENDEYFDYCQRCADNYERPADNYIDLEIEYPSEKEKDKEIERLNTDKEQLNSLVNSCQEEIRRLHSIIKEVREYIHWRLDNGQDMYITQMKELLEILDKV